VRRVVAVYALACGLLWGQAGPLARQKVDPAAAQRGRGIYSQRCADCHGAEAKGTDTGPDLMRSPLLMRDRLGSELGPALKRLPGHDSRLGAAQVIDLTHFLKQQIEATAVNRNPVTPPNVLTGDATAGRAYFDGTCAGCHSVTGDLAGIGKKFGYPLDLQQRFLFPRRSKPQRVTVTPPGVSGELVRGTLIQIDDFDVSLRDAAGQVRSWKRSADLRVEVEDPLDRHHELLDVYTDRDIHNVVRYLESLK
jgi:cytochrome c oxidase cbb3-type subunit 3